MGHNNRTIQSTVLTALVAMLAISVASAAMAPSNAEAAKRSSAFVYSKMETTSSSMQGIDPENWVYFAWESRKPLRINVADQVTDQVTSIFAGNVAVTNGDSKVTIRAMITESGAAGLNVGDIVVYTADLAAKTATLVNETTGQSASGRLIYANVALGR